MPVQGVINTGSSTDNAIARFDGATGNFLQNSSATVDDSGNAAFNSCNLAELSSDPSTPAAGTLVLWVSNGVGSGDAGDVMSKDEHGTVTNLSSAGGGSGDVVGPGSSTDNALARFDSTTGKLLQNSNATLGDNGGLAQTALAAGEVLAQYTAHASQTANLTEWRSSGGTVGARITAAREFSNQTASSGVENEAFGVDSLNSITTGDYNAAFGSEALKANTIGSSNLAFGRQALIANTEGDNNTAIGNGALRSCISGDNNIGVSNLALKSLTTGSDNSAFGRKSMENANGDFNVAFNFESLLNMDGTGNYGAGRSAGSVLTGGDYNILIGHSVCNSGSARSITDNIILGRNAGDEVTSNNNVLIGATVADNLTSGGSCVIIGPNIDAPSATASNQLNLMNMIFATGASGTGTTVSTGNVGIAQPAPADKLHITVGTTGAVECLQLEQLDVSEGFANFVATAAASVVNPISTWTTGNTIQGFLRIEVNGTDRWIPFYDAPTA
jgi:hypothetical protein